MVPAVSDVMVCTAGAVQRCAWKGVGIEPVVLVWDTLGGIYDSGDDGVSQPGGKGDGGANQCPYLNFVGGGWVVTLDVHIVVDSLSNGLDGVYLSDQRSGRDRGMNVGGWWSDSVERAVVAW